MLLSPYGLLTEENYCPRNVTLNRFVHCYINSPHRGGPRDHPSLFQFLRAASVSAAVKFSMHFLFCVGVNLGLSS